MIELLITFWIIMWLYTLGRTSRDKEITVPVVIAHLLFWAYYAGEDY